MHAHKAKSNIVISLASVVHEMRCYYLSVRCNVTRANLHKILSKYLHSQNCFVYIESF